MGEENELFLFFLETIERRTKEKKKKTISKKRKTRKKKTHHRLGQQRLPRPWLPVQDDPLGWLDPDVLVELRVRQGQLDGLLDLLDLGLEAACDLRKF